MKNEINKRWESISAGFKKSKSPIAFYIPYKVNNDIIYVSGQLPFLKSGELITGRVENAVSQAKAKQAARLCAIQILFHVYEACLGKFHLIKSCLNVKGYVQCANNFNNISDIIDGASETIVELFGDHGLHTRTAIGVYSLPRESIVEVEATFALLANNQQNY